MSKDKDPAFLFYPKDWKMGTAEYKPEEKGVYIDLLCHQHQKGSIPADPERLAMTVGLPIDYFMNIWDVIKENFVPLNNQMDDRLVNRKLNRLMKERHNRSRTNTITGTFASLLRTGDFSKKDIIFLKKHFNISKFEGTDTERLTERITEWIYDCLKSIGNGDGDEDGNENGDVTNETNQPNYDLIVEAYHTLCPEMPSVIKLTKMRKGYINARHKEFGDDGIRQVLEKAGSSSFLNGMNDRNWVANFEWLMKPENFVKVLEDKYKNKDSEKRLAV
jgi:hypothetical protein